MHVQIWFSCENNVANITSISLPLRLFPSLLLPLLAQRCSAFFYLKQKANYIKSNPKIWNKAIFSPFSQIWKIHLNPFLLWLLLFCSLCPFNVNWPVCAQHSCQKSDDDIHIRFRFGRICQVFTFNFLVKSINQPPLLLIITDSSWPQNYIQSCDWFDWLTYWLIISDWLFRLIWLINILIDYLWLIISIDLID